MLDVRPGSDSARLDGVDVTIVEPDITLADQMMAAAHAAGAAVPSEVADFAIDSFDAEPLLDRVPRPMSRGELQVCCLLIALAAPFERLCLIDPTAGLDARRRRAVVDLLRDLADDHEIVVASDDPLFAAG